MFSQMSEQNSDVITTKLMLRLLAPYFSLMVFWVLMHSAWLALLGYHLQIILWSKKSPFSKFWPGHKFDLAISITMAAAGPFVYFILPAISKIDLSLWLLKYQLSGWLWFLMIPYFGLVHPFLEQAHWGTLRDKTSTAHFFFAGYHAMVLYSLLPLFCLFAGFIVLAAASFIWQQIAKHDNNYSAPVLSHILADFGVVIAAWFLIH